MSGAEFEAYTAGKTLTYGIGGDAYGVEQYLPGRRVMWSFVGDECRAGTWYENATSAETQICFVYEYLPNDAQCWSFYATGTGLSARFVSDSSTTELTEVQQSPIGLNCPGPDLGV